LGLCAINSSARETTCRQSTTGHSSNCAGTAEQLISWTAGRAPARPGPVGQALRDNGVMTITEVLRQHPVFDGHNDLAYALRENYDYSIERAHLSEGNPELHTDLPALKRGGVGAQF